MSGLSVSVVMAAYNAEATLRHSLKAICSSSYNNYDVLVIDDASTDRTLEIIKEFNLSYKRLEKNRGAAYCRNLGAENTSGEIILFIDADIIIKSDTIQQIVNGYNDKSVMAVQGRISGEPANRGFGARLVALRWFYDSGKFPEFTSNPAHNLQPIFSVRRSCFEKIGGFNEAYYSVGCEEFEFANRLCKETKIRCLPNVEVQHHFEGVWKRSASLLRGVSGGRLF